MRWRVKTGVRVDFLNNVTTMTYDALNRLARVTSTDAGGTGVAVATYTYDAVGNRASVERANGTKTSYTYNRLNRLTGLSHTAGASLLLGLSYTLDASGLRTAIDESGAQVRHVDYQYDAVKRLTQESVQQSGNARSTSWTYDAVGNRLTQTQSVAGGSATMSLLKAALL